MCFAVRILVVASTRERRSELRRAAVSAEWEVIGEAEEPEEAATKAIALRARFVVLDEAAAGPQLRELASSLAAARPRIFLVGVGDVPRADAQVPADGLPSLRDVIARPAAQLGRSHALTTSRASDRQSAPARLSRRG